MELLIWLGRSEFFQWLWRASWQASVLAGLVLLVQWLFVRQLSPAWRYGLWMLVLVRLALPAVPGAPWSVFNLTQRPLVWNWMFGRKPKVATDSVIASRVQSTVEPGPLNSPGASYDVVIKPSVAAPLSVNAQKRWAATDLCLAAGSGLWLVGILFQWARWTWQKARFAAALRRAGQLCHSDLWRVLEVARRRIGVRRKVRLVETEAVRSPAVYGLFRPRLLLPKGGLESFTPDELGYICLHELAHIKRQDLLVNWLTGVLQSLHWFNPVLYWAFRRMRADRELAADTLALSHMDEGENQVYGETIIKILANLSQPAGSVRLVGILEDKLHLALRMRHIAGFEKGRTWPGVAIALFLGLALTALTDAQTTKSSAKRREGGQTELPTAASPIAVAAEDEIPELPTPRLIQDGKVLIEMGKLDEAEAKLREAIRRNPEDRNASYYLSKIKELRYSEEARQREISAKDALAEVEKPRDVPATGESQPLPNSSTSTNRLHTTTARESISQKLDKILIDELLYDGLPLSEVARDLNDLARKRDPDKHGINIMINSHADVPTATVPVSPGIDPTTGQPLPAAQTAEPVNLDDVIIRLHLYHVRLGDVFEAVCKGAETPIEYAVLDEGVMFRRRGVQPLFTRTYKVDPNTFEEGLRSVSEGDGMNSARVSDGAPIRSRLVESIRKCFKAAGVDFGPNILTGGVAGGGGVGFGQSEKARALFYNDRTGLFLVRGTLEDLDTVEKAIQMLNVAAPLVTIECRFTELSAAMAKALDLEWLLATNAFGFSAVTPLLITNRIGRVTIDAPRGLGQAGGSSAELLPGDRQITQGFARRVKAARFRGVLRVMEESTETELNRLAPATTVTGRSVRVEVATKDRSFGRVELVPFVSSDGEHVQMTVLPTWSEFAGYQDPEPRSAQTDEGRGGRSTSAPTGDRLPLPVFHVQNTIVPSFALHDGETMVIGGLGPIGTPPRDRADAGKQFLLFLTVSITDPTGNGVRVLEP
jgi:beta-lactamase regulating signal transducer with metallopeptidase domain